MDCLRNSGARLEPSEHGGAAFRFGHTKVNNFALSPDEVQVQEEEAKGLPWHSHVLFSRLRSRRRRRITGRVAGKMLERRERYGLVIRRGPFLINDRGRDDFWWPPRDKRNLRRPSSSPAPVHKSVLELFSDDSTKRRFLLCRKLPGVYLNSAPTVFNHPPPLFLR